MAPEAPADTAGPSSPPPQLPEGWLPQWEGVGRKWYYVQRTTGKSQWEIPTEPIFLTPSTTPTPSGAGLSQEPKSYPTSNNTRELESTDRMAGEMYSAADSAKISNSLGSQIYGQSENPTYGSSGVPGWYSNQTGQHLPGGYEQQMAANAAGYGPNPLHQGPVGHLNGVQPAFYGSQTHPGYQITGPHHIGQSISSSMWGNNSGTYQGNPGSYNMTQHAQSFQGFSADPVGLHNHQPPASWAITSNPQGEMARSMGGASDSQPQWQLEPQQGHLNGSGEGVPMNLHPSNMPKPFFGSYSSNQHADPSSREFARRVSNPSLVQEGQPYQTSAENFHNHSPHSMVEQGRFGQGEDPRSHSQRTTSDPALQGFSPLQHVQSQYQQQHMIRKQSGPHQVNIAQGHQQYQNPIAQVGANQYVSQHQFGPNGGPTGFPETTHVQQVPYHQSSHYPEHIEHSPGETRRGSESHFVSGPWTSTPPSTGQY
ncbi:WW/Rsp5/WWP [Penicillium psychrosexuale]|uniref:WW/Rsp5/WWP n=1 Tax=Penicillium psychrosexuale TaxID=1002107 RepID=UPI002544EEE4|nr:WW/Rsp5/WWP [Penicillium psychrosexuale]KAJ5790878.1 WW/Rsp5/WWP [Penicillium psychrosexuale]